jgi:hypothetical protein
MLSVINRLKLVPVQQLRQFARVVAIILVPYFSQGVFARVADQHLCNVRLEQIVQPGRPGSFFKGHAQAATKTTQKLEYRLGLRLENGFHHQLARGI